ncbi:colicin immunity domain-containing protein [Orbaceae bacterium ac157xtp]
MKNEIDELLLMFAKSFVNECIDGNVFSQAFMELWRIKRDYFSHKEEHYLGECIGSLFIAADNYNPDEDREDYEFNEHDFRMAVTELLSKYEEHCGKCE